MNQIGIKQKDREIDFRLKFCYFLKLFSQVKIFEKSVLSVQTG